MALLDTFQGLPDTIFKIFGSLVLQGNFVMDSTNDGWSNIAPSGDDAPAEYPVQVIRTSFTKLDLEKTSFYEFVQVKDVIGLVKGIEVTVPIDTADAFEITDRFGLTTKYNIVAYDVDAADALYILLLRAG